MSEGDTLIVFTRYPEPGRVKTRLIPALGEQGAASLHCEMIRFTLETSGKLASAGGTAVEVHYDGGNTERMGSLFGSAFPYIPQKGADLGERMLASLTRCLSKGSKRAVLMGTDCPGITESILRQAFFALQESDCVLGPSLDGGYYLIGMIRPLPELFSSIPWGTGRVLPLTLEAIDRLGLKATLLEGLADVDRPEDLPVWESCFHTRSKPKISVVIPAFNEGDCIEKTVRQAQQGRNVEVIVTDGGSRDRTEKLAARMGARILHAGQGRAVQMNEGAYAATGEILLFLHADTHLPRGYDGEIRAALSNEGVAAGAFSLSFDEGSFALSLIATGANMRSHCLSLPYGDQGLFVRRDIFLELGGFPEIPIMEDVAFVWRIRHKGRVVIMPARVITSSRRFHSLSPLRTWVLNQLCMAGYFLGVPLKDLSMLYRSQEPALKVWMAHLTSALKKRAWNGKGKALSHE